MSPVEAFKSYAPSVAHLVFFQGDQRISSGSGFLVRDRLVTCAHVVERMGANHMKVRFPYAEAGQTQEWDVPAGVQSLTFCGFSGEQSYDYALIDPPAYVAIGPSLSFAEEETEVGGQLCGLGFPFERDELSLCVGYVSAAVNSGVAAQVGYERQSKQLRWPPHRSSVWKSGWRDRPEIDGPDWSIFGVAA